MSFSLYQKYRPKNFSEMVGRENIVKILSNSIKNDRISHAYLFTGSRGTGKTTLARIFAKAVNCLEIKKNERIEPCGKCENCKLIEQKRSLDFVEIDAASHTGVDNIRQIKENSQTAPVGLKYKIYIIDEVHMLSTGAFNALLKTLEEPPSHCIFILATTEIHKIPETVLSRCQKFDFKKLSLSQIITRLEKIAQKEKIQIDAEALEIIAIQSEGGMRDAESLLGQIMSIEDKKITAKEVSDILGISPKKTAIEIIDFIFSCKNKEALEKISAIQKSGLGMDNIFNNLSSLLRDFLVLKANENNSKEILEKFSPSQKKQIETISKEVTFEKIIFLIELLQKNATLFKENPISGLYLEISIIEFHLRYKKDLTEKKIAPIKKEEIPSEKIVADEKIEEIKKNKKTEKRKEETIDEHKNNGKGGKKIADVEANVSLSNIMDNWSKILEKVKPFNHSINAFLKNCIPFGIKDKQLFIKVKYDLYKEKLGEINNRLTIEKVIAKISGCHLKIVFVSEDEAKNLHFEDNYSASSGQDIIYDAMKIMGGKIVEK